MAEAEGILLRIKISTMDDFFFFYILEKDITSTELEFITVNKVEISYWAKTKTEELSPLSLYRTTAFFKISDSKCAWKILVRVEFEDTIHPSEVSMYTEAYNGIASNWLYISTL